MNKLKLGVKGLKDVLSREELKQILGGNSGSGGSGREMCNCNTKDTCETTDPKKPQGCMADCDTSSGYAGHCAWDGTSGK